MHRVGSAFVVFALAVGSASACSLLAPSDADMMGGRDAGALDGAGADAGGGDDAEQGGSSSAASGKRPTAGAGESSVAAGGTGDADGNGLGVAGAGGASDWQAGAPLPDISREKLLLWLTADHGVGQAEGGVALWTDQSDSGQDASQSLAPSRPKLIERVGQLPVLEFDGVNDQLVMGDGFSDFTAGLTAFVIANVSEDSECPSVLHLSNEPEHEDIEIGRYHGSVHYEAGDDDTWGPENAFLLNQRVMLGVFHDAAGMATVRINGNYMASKQMALPATMTRSNNLIGRSLYSNCGLFKGQVGEIILYGRALSAAERQEIQEYLQEKWHFAPKVKPKPVEGDGIQY